MWLISKIRQVMLVLKAGVVTLRYPFVPRAVQSGFRGQPSWDHHKCVGCAGCANHCPARTIMVRDLCQDIRVMVYDGSRCTYCGRCADVCPEKAISMSEQFELATGDKNDISVTLELFMFTCQRCGRCYNMETTNMIDKMKRLGYRYDSIQFRAMIPVSTEQFSTEMLAKTEAYRRPVTKGEK
ncbi:MAG: 4Fe-4S binding protein [Spirochaetes bacterium]|nr:4Fe-4S binding protein [Spirochaetota bacterium]